MDSLFQVDWKSAFVPTVSIAEIILRGTFVYLFLFVLLRLLRRESGAIGITDLLMVVLIADAAQNAMASEYKSITEGFILVATIVFWDFALDWLGYRFPAFRRLIRPKALPLVMNGRMLPRNMKKEMITEEELMGRLREQGVDNIADVKKAYLEGDGQISVITSKPEAGRGAAEKKALK